MANIEKTLQVFIPMVTSNVIQSNGLTPYINFYIERLYLAHNINKFTKFAGLNTSKKIAGAIAAIFGALALGVKIYKDYWGGIKTRNDVLTQQGGNQQRGRPVSSSTQFTEDLKYIMDKPTQVNLGNAIINFVVMNFITDKNINQFRLKTDQTKSLFQKLVSKFFRSSVSIVTKDTFYAYSIEELGEKDIKEKLSESPNNNVVIVDNVNDLVVVYMKYNGALTRHTVKLSKITNDRKSMGNDVDIDKVIKSLKSIQVSKL